MAHQGESTLCHDQGPGFKALAPAVKSFTSGEVILWVLLFLSSSLTYPSLSISVSKERERGGKKEGKREKRKERDKGAEIKEKQWPPGKVDSSCR